MGIGKQGNREIRKQGVIECQNAIDLLGDPKTVVTKDHSQPDILKGSSAPSLGRMFTKPGRNNASEHLYLVSQMSRTQSRKAIK